VPSIRYSADVVCLQDVDFVGEFWQPKLGVAGYDCVFHRRSAHARPRTPTSEGVLIAWDRDLFTLATSEGVDLNDQFPSLR
jgi:mRNA deadenylase 3'-5' endonuclease subunit Ccr4